MTMIAGGIYGTYHQSTTLSKIDSIFVLGCKYFSAQTVREIAQNLLLQKKSLSYLQQWLQEIDFIQSVKVQILNNTILIHITERTIIAKTIDHKMFSDPVSAIITTKPKFYLNVPKIDISATQISLKNPDSTTHTYPQDLNVFIQLISTLNPELCIYVRPNRWDIKLHNKTLKLNDNIKQSLQHWQTIPTALKTQYTTFDFRKNGYVLMH